MERKGGEGEERRGEGGSWSFALGRKVKVGAYEDVHCVAKPPDPGRLKNRTAVEIDGRKCHSGGRCALIAACHAARRHTVRSAATSSFGIVSYCSLRVNCCNCPDNF